MNYRFYPQAEQEFAEAAAWYEARKPNLGAELIEAIFSTVDRIQNNPFCGECYRRTQFRVLTVSRFPYFIVYRQESDSIWIVAVAHGSRKEGYWRRRQPPL